MKVAIYGQNYAKETTRFAFRALLDVLQEAKTDIHIEVDFLKQQSETMHANPAIKKFTELDKSFDLLISIGGDGTILRAITYVRDLGIPIVGINTDRYFV